jgi:hypothetical protein
MNPFEPFRRAVDSPAHARLGAFVALAALCACSSNSGPRYPDVTSFCGARASAECNDQVLLACGLPSASACIAKRQQVCVLGAPPGTTYNASSAEGCVNETSSVYADAKVTLDESTALTAACLGVFDGPAGKDATCTQDGDCKVSTGLRCVHGPGSATGTCHMPQSVAGGGSCAAADQQCAAGFHCGPTAHCDIDAAANETCDDADPCQPGLMCGTGGTCVDKTADGSACATDGECLHGICNKQSTAAMGVCVSQVTLAQSEPFCTASQ